MVGKITALILATILCINPSGATCIVVLANKTQIALAADSMIRKQTGEYLGKGCKIFHLRDFYFVISGTLNRKDLESLGRASLGTNDLAEIQGRFDRYALTPIQETIDYGLAHIRGYMQELKTNKQRFQIILFRLTKSGPVMRQSLFQISFSAEGKPKIGSPFHNICNNGGGECSLIVGVGDEAREYVKTHPIGKDLVANAENLVRLEARANPDKVGGQISMMLLDAEGSHPINMIPGCPLEVTVTVHK